MTRAKGLTLPSCGACDRAHWPLREVCPHCLGSDIAEQQAADGGQTIASVTLHHSLDAATRDRLPLHVTSILLDAGPVVFAFVDGPLSAGGRVRIHRTNNGTFHAACVDPA